MNDAQFRDLDELIVAAQDRAGSDPVHLPARELIGYFGARARGARVNRRVRDRLQAAGLRTDPDFSVGNIDGHVSLVRPTTDRSAEPADEFQVKFLRVHTLSSATQTVVWIKPQESIEKARTLMALNDFSQLAVCPTLRADVQAVSWESIGRALLREEVKEARHAAVHAEVVKLGDDLLPLLPKIASAGYVFVRDETNQLCGIVTAADVTYEFGALAGPFFLLGEIERRLRVAVDRAFEPGELLGMVDPDDRRDVETSEDLSFGELKRLIEHPERWDKLGWPVDRPLFLARIEDIRAIRNSLMHFSSDLPSEEDVDKMQTLLTLLKDLVGD